MLAIRYADYFRNIPQPQKHYSNVDIAYYNNNNLRKYVGLLFIKLSEISIE